MNLAPRELKLLGATILVVLVAGTWLFLAPAIDEWNAHEKKIADLETRRSVAERLLRNKPHLEEEMAEFLAGLPVYPMGKKAESTLLPALEALGGDLLTKREVGAERPARDLYETSITCHWQGSLDRLVHFLYDQQSQGAASDMRMLSVQTGSGSGGNKAKGQLNGRFTLDYAYRREAEPQDGGADAPDGASTETSE